MFLLSLLALKEKRPPTAIIYETVTREEYNTRTVKLDPSEVFIMLIAGKAEDEPDELLASYRSALSVVANYLPKDVTYAILFEKDPMIIVHVGKHSNIILCRENSTEIEITHDILKACREMLRKTIREDNQKILEKVEQGEKEIAEKMLKVKKEQVKRLKSQVKGQTSAGMHIIKGEIDKVRSEIRNLDPLYLSELTPLYDEAKTGYKAAKSFLKRTNITEEILNQQNELIEKENRAYLESDDQEQFFIDLFSLAAEVAGDEGDLNTYKKTADVIKKSIEYKHEMYGKEDKSSA